MSRASQNLAAWQVLSRAHRRLDSHLDGALKAADLPGLDVLGALQALADSAEPPAARTLEQLLMMPQYGVSRLLDRMEAGALVTRTTDSADKRIRHVHLTDRGRSTLAAMVAARDAALDAFLAPRAKPGQLDRIADLLGLLDQDVDG